MDDSSLNHSMSGTSIRITINDKPTDITELKVTELKVELKKRGLSCTGAKKELYEKLKAYLLKSGEYESGSEAAVSSPQKDTPHSLSETTADISIDASINDPPAPIEPPAPVPEASVSNGIECVAEHEQKPSPDLITAPQVPQNGQEVKIDENETLKGRKEEIKAEAVKKEEYKVQEAVKEEQKIVEAVKEEEKIVEVAKQDHKTVDEDEEAKGREASPVSSASTKSESVCKEVPMSGERNRFSRSRSPKARWHGSVAKEHEHESHAIPVEVVGEANEPVVEGAAHVLDAAVIPKTQRKRKWMTGDPMKNMTGSVTISSETLKTILPAEAKPPLEGEVKDDEGAKSAAKRKAAAEDDGEPAVKHKERTVIFEDNELIYEDGLGETKAAVAADGSKDHVADGADETTVAATGRQVVAGEFVVRMDTSASVTPHVHVRNLTRPFTMGQLKELLNKYGRTLDDKFWIDNVKSHCYVTYENIDNAKEAKEALNGTKWPQSNPKTLVCEYVSTEDVERQLNACQSKASAPVPSTTNKGNDVKERRDESKGVNNTANNRHTTTATPTATISKSDTAHNEPKRRERDREKERDQRDKEKEKEREKDKERPVREWDLPKLKEREKERDRSASVDRKRKEKTEAKKEKPKVEEPPPKLLDDLFSKTKATPCIYWLPLSEEQVIERAKEKERRAMERKERELQRDKERQAKESQPQQNQPSLEKIEPDAKQPNRDTEKLETDPKRASKRRNESASGNSDGASENEDERDKEKDRERERERNRERNDRERAKKMATTSNRR